MKTAALVPALMILAIGLVSIVAPSCLVWIARQTLSPRAFCVIGTLRVAYGLVLISASSTSRSRNGLRLLGWIILGAGLATILSGLVAIDRAHAVIEWWVQQGDGMVRLTGVVILVPSGFVVCACAPGGRLGRG